MLCSESKPFPGQNSRPQHLRLPTQLPQPHREDPVRLLHPLMAGLPYHSSLQRDQPRQPRNHLRHLYILDTVRCNLHGKCHQV